MVQWWLMAEIYWNNNGEIIQWQLMKHRENKERSIVRVISFTGQADSDINRN